LEEKNERGIEDWVLTDTEQGLLAKLGHDRPLDRGIGSGIDRARRLVQTGDPGRFDERPSERNKLPFACRKVWAFVVDLGVELELVEPRLVHRPVLCPEETGSLEGVVEARIVVFFRRVEVLSHRSGVEKRVLRDNGDSLSECVQSDGSRISSVDDDLTARRFDDPEEGLQQRGLACSRSTDDLAGANGRSGRGSELRMS
jgi:hypothetical protein